MSLVSYIWPVGVKPSFPWGRYPSGGYHPAYDFAVPTGTAVHAPASGKIIVAGWDTTGYGIHVRILHSTGHMSILAHNETLLVSVGQYVQQGQQVSWSDSTGNSSGPHVHWETRVNSTGLQRDTAYDPGPYVGAGLPFNDQLPGPTSPSSGGPVVPSVSYGMTAGLVIQPMVQNLSGEQEAVQIRFSPALAPAA